MLTNSRLMIGMPNTHLSLTAVPLVKTEEYSKVPSCMEIISYSSCNSGIHFKSTSSFPPIIFFKPCQAINAFLNPIKPNSVPHSFLLFTELSQLAFLGRDSWKGSRFPN